VLTEYIDKVLGKKEMYVYQFSEVVASDMMLYFNSNLRIINL
jgi:hypothetical protein